MRARFAEFVLDTELRQLLRGLQPLHLTPKALALLEYLVERRPRALSKSQILERVWPATFVSESNLASLVKEIRRALGDDAHRPRFVRTVQGFGYAFAADVLVESDPSGGAAAATPPPGTEFRILWDRREILLSPGENVLGRTRQAVVWVEHDSVSRRHAVIRVEGDIVTVEDCGSKNGTSLRGKRLEAPQTLADGDEILLGRARLVFRAYRAEAPTVTASRKN